MLHKKHFSLSEAQDLLPQLKILLSSIKVLKRKLDEAGFDIYKHQYFGGMSTNGTGRYPENLEELIKVFQKISEMGIIIKGIDTGLIDFPHIRSNGKEVYLCYLLGEENIDYWHNIEDGFAGRKSVSDL